MNTEQYELPVELPHGLLTPFDAAEILEISVDELATLRLEGKGPAYMAVVRDIVRYHPDVIESYRTAPERDAINFPDGW